MVERNTANTGARPDTRSMEDEGANVGGHASVAAGAIVAYWLADGYVIGLPVVALAAIWNPLIVFLAALSVAISINLAACRWIQHGVEQLGKRKQWRADRTPTGQTATHAGRQDSDAVDRQRFGRAACRCGGPHLRDRDGHARPQDRRAATHR